jgi:membrane fusion protein (multidrug efflux system)
VSKTVRYVLILAAVLSLVGGLAAVKSLQFRKLIAFGEQAQAAGLPPEFVGSVKAEGQSWEDTIDAVGSVASAKGVALSTDVAGVVSAIHFESGRTVKKGDVLVELDSKVERAQLASAISRRQLAATTRDRTRTLSAKGAISAAQLDADESAFKTSTTDVEALQAQIAKKTIRAPFSGKLGIRAVNLGQFLNPGTAITVLETVDEIHVDFSLPQQRLAELKTGMPVKVTLDGDESTPINGTLAAVDPQVDAATRSIKLRADLANEGRRLRPGMFVAVKVEKADRSTFVAVPATAIVHASYGDSVFVIEDKAAGEPGMRQTPDGKPVKTARQQFVRVGPSRGDYVGVLQGVSAGQEVVTAGAFKLHNGSPILVDNSKPMTPKRDPRPENR